MVLVSAQIRTGKSGFPAISRISAQLYRSLPRSTWIRSRAQSIDVRQIASVIISAKPPRASCIGGASDVRPRSISFASSSQFTLLTDHTCKKMGLTSYDAICTRSGSRQLMRGNRAAILTYESARFVSITYSGRSKVDLSGIGCTSQIAIGRSFRSASNWICDGTSFRPSAVDVMNRMPCSARFAERASSTISTRGPKAMPIGGSSFSPVCIHSSASAHQSLISTPTNAPIVTPSAYSSVPRLSDGQLFLDGNVLERLKKRKHLNTIIFRLGKHKIAFVKSGRVDTDGTAIKAKDRRQIETGKSGLSARLRICGNDSRRSTPSYEIYSLVRSGSGHAITLPTISSSGPRVSWRCGSAAEIGRRQRHTPERQFMSVMSGNVSNGHQLLLTGLYVIHTGQKHHQLGSMFSDWDTTCVSFGQFEGVATRV